MQKNGSRNCRHLESFIDIGGVTVRLTGTESMEHVTASRAFIPFLTAPAGVMAEIRMDETLPEEPFRIIHTFNFQENTTCTFGRNGTGCHFVMQADGGDRLLMRYDGDRLLEISRCNDNPMLFFALWMGFNLIGCLHGSISIHASCVIHQGAAILFLGESGTGKSTQSRLWMETFPGTELLNDDGPFLAPWEGKYHVFGTPWSGKTPCYRNLHCPIKAIIRVKQAAFNRITPLPTLQQIGALLPSFPPALSRDRILLPKMLSIVSALLADTHVYQLECLPDSDAARTAHRILFPEP